MANRNMATELDLYLYSPCNQNKNGFRYNAHADSLDVALEYAMTYEDDTTDYSVMYWDNEFDSWVLITHKYWIDSTLYIREGKRFVVYRKYM